MVGSKCCDFKIREVSNVNAPIDGRGEGGKGEGENVSIENKQKQ